MSTETNSTSRFAQGDLVDLAACLLTAAGLDADKATCVAGYLVAADAMGHGTHGLALMPMYLEALVKRGMQSSGSYQVVNDRGSCLTWDGQQLPGAWLIHQALDAAMERVQQHGVVTVAIRNSHHTGALAVYLSRATERGLIAQLQCSSPAASGIAPFGGTKALFTPNPVAAGYPTQTDPVLLDISSSITTLNNARQLKSRGERFPRPWAMDAQGQPSDDPDVVISGQGSLLPVGGTDHGHKGYAMALLTEALTQGLSGYGRANQPQGMRLGVLLQVTDPAAFAGLDAFTQQTQWTADACRANPPLPGGPAVRLPGQAGLAKQRVATTEGVPLIPAVVGQLQAAAQRLGVAAAVLQGGN
jgi:L-lactate dehydrogenase